MSQSHLTQKYRPQLFSEVAGQGMIKSILSRAAATGAVAPAYMFSGTRGVGKTTIARIFAKAINCENGPGAEPCNKCGHCRQIQAGAAVDVAEIDGASHTGVDNVRSLKEDVGFAPIDCRYKVFIIDEAHMLSKGAFNALLKTLEEPPPHATFIMATTEPHKFPATIISRCQHYTFQRLTQKELEDHLRGILNKESLDHDADAVALLARRGAGSVRDAMSLMGQVLALGGDRLTAADVRQVLGLAGREIMFRLLAAIHAQDCVGVSEILREVLDQGLDLGFFLRELTECWRNLFLISQAGDRAMDVLDAPDEEMVQWREWAAKFPLAHVHACWQLTLEGQQRVKSSVEPALALELLLLNLAYLPRLMPLADIAATGGAPTAPAAPAQGGGGRGASASAPQQPPAPQRRPPWRENSAPQAEAPAESAPADAPQADSPSAPGAAASSQGGEVSQAQRANGAGAQSGSASAGRTAPQASAPPSSAPPASAPGPDASPVDNAPPAHEARPMHDAPPMGEEPPLEEEPPFADEGTAPAPAAAPRESRVSEDSLPPVPQGPRNWEGFLSYAQQVRDATGKGINGLEQAGAVVEGKRILLQCKSRMHADQIRRGEHFARLNMLVREFFGPGFQAELQVRDKPRANPKQARENAASHPLVNKLVDDMDARIMDVRSRNTK